VLCLDNEVKASLGRDGPSPSISLTVAYREAMRRADIVGNDMVDTRRDLCAI
jgi:hypothetical protein